MITASYLASLGACSDHVSRFAAAFPGGLDLATCDVDATAAAVVAAGLAVEWAVERLLTPAGRAESERVAAAARAEYDRVVATARAESDRVVAPAWAESERVAAHAWAEYERASAAAIITAAREHGITTTPQD